MSRGRGSPLQRPQVWGYVPNYDREAAWASVREHRELLSGVSLFQHFLSPDGDLGEYPGLANEPSWVAEFGLSVVPMVANLIDDRWDREVVASVLGNPASRRSHMDRLVALAVEGSYPAIELDYESLAAEDRELVSRFVEELANVLHDRAKQLSLAVHAKLSEPGEGGGAAAQDWAALGRAADRIVVMTYDRDATRPGAIAPIGWTEEVLRFALSQMPAGRVIQGIPFYGYDWSERGPTLYRTYREMTELAQVHGVQADRDSADRYLVLEYQGSDGRHVVWMPDGETVRALMAIGHQLGVGGYAIWRMGGEAPDTWDPVRALIPSRGP